jgi:hypothetical protein
VKNRNIFDKYLEIILNHDPSKLDSNLKEYDKIVNDSDKLDSYIDALEKKIELEFQPLPKSISISKSKSKAKPKPKPVVNVNLTPIVVRNEINDQYEIPNGLLGVNRDTFNKLAAHRWVQDDDLQQMYGISQRAAVPWKNHFTFTLKRLQKPVSEPHT